MGLCVVITTASYIKILMTLRKRRIAIQQLSEDSAQNHPANVKRYGKTTMTMWFVFVVFMLCYLPYLCTMVLGSALGESFSGIGSAESIVTAIAYLKSVINPLILFWRINEIQKGILQVLRRSVTVTNDQETIRNRLKIVDLQNRQ